MEPIKEVVETNDETAVDIDIASEGIDIDGSMGRRQCDITGVLNERIVRNRNRKIVGCKNIKVARQGTQINTAIGGRHVNIAQGRERKVVTGHDAYVTGRIHVYIASHRPYPHFTPCRIEEYIARDEGLVIIGCVDYSIQERIRENIITHG
jgi:hypothetical protein